MDPSSNPRQSPQQAPDDLHAPGLPADANVEPADTAPAAPQFPGRDAVTGERAIPSINRAQSIRVRAYRSAAIAVIAVLSLAFLYWYFDSAISARQRVDEAERRAREARAAGDSRPPRFARPEHPPTASAAPPAILDAPPVPPAPPYPAAPVPPPPPAMTGPKPKTRAELELERLLNASVTLRPSAQAVPISVPGMPVAPGANAALGGGAQPTLVAANDGPPGATASGSLAASLRPTATPAVRAQLLPDRRFLLPKGAFIDCTLETALDSTLAGLATCIVPVDIFSADGKVVLIERGTRFVGETRSEVRQGQARIGVLWNEARTPHGVSVALASPGTDELGRTGLPGHVDRHFWERFGSAILISVIDGAIQAAVASQREGGSAPIYTPNTSRDVLTEVLRSTVNIPPTVIKNQGERIQVLVARDVDFRPVYTLETRP